MIELVITIGDVCLFMIFIAILRCNSLKEDNTTQLKSLNKNLTTFNDRERLVKVVRELNNKINKLK